MSRESRRRRAANASASAAANASAGADAAAAAVVTLLPRRGSRPVERYLIDDPSGQRLTAAGHFQMVTPPGAPGCPAVLRADGALTLLDPRALVVALPEGRLVYLGPDTLPPPTGTRRLNWEKGQGLVLFASRQQALLLPEAPLEAWRSTVASLCWCCGKPLIYLLVNLSQQMEIARQADSRLVLVCLPCRDAELPRLQERGLQPELMEYDRSAFREMMERIEASAE
jgi:hypothetical protein